jgi:glutamyl/glutaminyl-tRNA synthetase
MIFYPIRFLAGLRLIELLTQTLIFLAAIWAWSLLKFDLMFFGSSLAESNPLLYSITGAFSFIVYKFLSTHTVVDKLELCNDEKLIKIEYNLFHTIKRKIEIKHEDFSFFYRKDSLHFGGSVGIRIFNKNKFKVKLNAKNGWKKEKIEQIIQEFLNITNGKTRKKSYL